MDESSTRDWEEIRRQRSLNEAHVLSYQRLMRADMLLDGLRHRRGLSELTLTDNTERFEQQDDLYLGTLAQYVAALGGQLEVRAVFPDEAITVLSLPEDTPDSSGAGT